VPENEVDEISAEKTRNFGGEKENFGNIMCA
jgi:hypothetical protein